VEDGGRADGVLPEAGLEVGESFRRAGEVAVGDAAESLGTEGEAKLGVETVAGAAGEGVLVDLRVGVVGDVLVAQGFTVAKHAAGVDDNGKLRVQVVVRGE